MIDQLEQAIQDLYSCFRVYHIKHPVQGSPISVTNAMQDQLASRTLRELTGSELDGYVWKAMSTWGTETDFKHFLPRILEILAVHPHEFSLATPDVIFGKLQYAAFITWSNEEKLAVENYLLALWKYILERFPSRTITAHEFLGMIEPVEPCLVYWQTKLNEPPAILHLVELILWDYNILDLGLNRQKHDKTQPMMKWLLSDKLPLLEAAFYDSSLAAFSEDISHAFDNLMLLSEI